MIVKGVRLHKIDDIESVRFACFGVRHSEIVPLGITSSVVIRLQNKIVFVFVNLDSPT